MIKSQAMRTHYSWSGFGVLLLVVGGVGAARADTVVPLVPKLDPPAAAERITQFHDALAQGLKAGGLTVSDPAAVRAKLKLGVENAGCDEGPCVATNLGLVGGKRCATARITSVGKNYTIDVRLFSGGKLVTKSTGRCDICTNTEAVQTLVKLATEVGSKGEEPPTPTPVPVPVPRPEPKVVPKPVPKPVPTPTPAPTPTPTGTDQPTGPVPAKRVWPLWPGIVAAGAGVVGLAVGIPLIAIDGKGTNCRGDARPDNRNCQDLVSTKGGGWTLTAMGIASLAASGVLFYLHFSSKPSEQRKATVERFSFAPLPEGGVALGASGRF